MMRPTLRFAILALFISAMPARAQRVTTAAPGNRPAKGADLVDGQATGNDGGPGADSGRLLRHHERRDLGES